MRHLADQELAYLRVMRGLPDLESEKREGDIDGQTCAKNR